MGPKVKLIDTKNEDSHRQGSGTWGNTGQKTVNSWIGGVSSTVSTKVQHNDYGQGPRSNHS